ncbi:hypothetical protein GCM10023225_03650 [Kineococcus glutinatus]|uniref:Uncharacterized protein n=1 Tax=Kineococcus glutinatus TaxID=1070872 RepID=A0ABP9H830_9ACTN
MSLWDHRPRWGAVPGGGAPPEASHARPARYGRDLDAGVVADDQAVGVQQRPSTAVVVSSGRQRWQHLPLRSVRRESWTGVRDP